MTILAQSTSSGSPLSFLIFLLPLGLLWYLFRNQKKRMADQQALQQAAEVGDEVLTTSGIFGTIIEADDEEGTVVVEIAPGTQIKMVRAGIARTLTEDDEYVEDGYEDGDDAEGDDDVNAQGPIGS